MDIQQVYAELCKQLGDISYKIKLYKQEYERILAEITKLDEIAGKLKEAAQAAETSQPVEQPTTPEQTDAAQEPTPEVGTV